MYISVHIYDYLSLGKSQEQQMLNNICFNQFLFLPTVSECLFFALLSVPFAL